MEEYKKSLLAQLHPCGKGYRYTIPAAPLRCNFLYNYKLENIKLKAMKDLEIDAQAFTKRLQMSKQKTFRQGWLS